MVRFPLSNRWRLKAFLHAYPPPKEWMRELEGLAVTHRVVLFLLTGGPADMSTTYGKFLDELNTRKIVFTTKSTVLQPKAMSKVNYALYAILIPKLNCTKEVVQEVAKKSGYVK